MAGGRFVACDLQLAPHPPSLTSSLLACCRCQGKEFQHTPSQTARGGFTLGLQLHWMEVLPILAAQILQLVYVLSFLGRCRLVSLVILCHRFQNGSMTEWKGNCHLFFLFKVLLSLELRQADSRCSIKTY